MCTPANPQVQRAGRRSGARAGSAGQGGCTSLRTAPAMGMLSYCVCLLPSVIAKTTAAEWGEKDL